MAAHRARRLPAELTEQARWVRWKTVERAGRPTRMPITLTGSPASSTDPATWTDYARANSSKRGDGLGFVLGAGIACLDLDHCLDSLGRPSPLARQVLDATPDAYVEVSPSGTGLHVWGTAPEQRGRRLPEIEVYSVGRYITVTRNVFRQGRLVDLSAFF